MCVGVSGKVVSFDEKTAVIESNGAKIKVRRDFVDISKGDLVMVHAGYIMQRITEDDAEIMSEIYNGIK